MVIAPVVEGHGEVHAVPRLLRRIAAEVGFAAPLRINAPIRVKSGSFLNDEPYFAAYVAMAAAKARQSGNGTVLILLDCEDDCPGRLGPHLLQRARAVAPDVRVIDVLAFREYETWFVAAVESLRSTQGLAVDAQAPGSPEATRDAKGWLGRLMPYGYDPISDQLPFTNAFNFGAARRVPSFDRLYRKIAALLAPPA